MEKTEEIEDVDEFPEETEDTFEESFDEIDEDEDMDLDEDFEDDDAEELFKQNPLRAIFTRQSEIMEMLENGN